MLKLREIIGSLCEVSVNFILDFVGFVFLVLGEREIFGI